MPVVPPLRRIMPGWPRVRSKEEGERTSDKEEKEEMGKQKREKWRRNKRREKEARKKEKGMKGIQSRRNLLKFLLSKFL